MSVTACSYLNSVDEVLLSYRWPCRIGSHIWRPINTLPNCKLYISISHLVRPFFLAATAATHLSPNIMRLAKVLAHDIAPRRDSATRKTEELRQPFAYVAAPDFFNLGHIWSKCKYLPMYIEQTTYEYTELYGLWAANYANELCGHRLGIYIGFGRGAPRTQPGSRFTARIICLADGGRRSVAYSCGDIIQVVDTRTYSDSDSYHIYIRTAFLPG